MEATKENKKNDFAFYALMIILSVSVLYILGYLVYEMIFG
jgi:hypothetical protein